MTKAIQFQAIKPGKGLWVLDAKGQIWLQKGAEWLPVIVGLPVSARPKPLPNLVVVKVPPLAGAVVSDGSGRTQPPFQERHAPLECG